MAPLLPKFDVIFTEAMAGQVINQNAEFLPRVTVKIKQRRQARNIHVGKFIAYFLNCIPGHFTQFIDPLLAKVNLILHLVCCYARLK